MKSSNVASHKTGRIRHASRQLATEVNPVTLEAMRLENVKLENRLLALEQLQSAELELRMAVHEWFMDEETELVVDLEDGAVFTTSAASVVSAVSAAALPAPVTLSFLLEHSLYALHFWAFERALYGELPRYLCEDCRDPQCGTSTVCGKFMGEAKWQGMTALELVNHLREVRTPLRFRIAARSVIEARQRVERYT